LRRRYLPAQDIGSRLRYVDDFPAELVPIDVGAFTLGVLTAAYKNDGALTNTRVLN